MASLTDRERQIVILLGEGVTPKQIARLLGLRHATVRKHIFRAREKTDCATVIELAVKIATAQ